MKTPSIKNAGRYNPATRGWDRKTKRRGKGKFKVWPGNEPGAVSATEPPPKPPKPRQYRRGS